MLTILYSNLNSYWRCPTTLSWSVFSLELCSYPVTFLWARRFLTWPPTQVEGLGHTSWFSHLLLSPSALADKERLVTALHPPTVAAAAVLAPPNWQLLYNLLFTPFCRGILTQTLRSLPPKLLPYFKAYWIALLLGKAPNSMITIHVTQITDLGSDLMSLLAWGASLQISSTSLGLLYANSDDTLQTNPG